MLTLMLKDLRRSVMPIISFVVLALLVMVLIQVALNELEGMEWSVFFDFNFLVAAAVILYMLVYSVVFKVEKLEDKNKGYSFLRTLPVSVRQIVAAKYLLVLFLDLLGLGFLLLCYSIFSIETEPALSTAFLVLSANLALTASGLVYLGIYAMGYVRLRVAIYAFLFALMILPSALLTAFVLTAGPRNLVSVMEKFAEAVVGVNPLLVGACGLALYFGMMVLAMKIKENEGA